MKSLFAVVAGPRLAGKTTLAGTLPGTTLLLQAAVLESGSRSAEVLARKRGNKLTIETFTDLIHLRSLLEKAAKDSAYDHIYIDGYSAINDIRWQETDIQSEFKKNQFGAYGKHGDDMTKFVAWIKGFTYAPYNKNIFLTCALKADNDDVNLECKGKMAVTAITKMGEAVLTVTQIATENGVNRVLVTKNFEKWPGRIDGVLDEDNPVLISPPDLGAVLKLQLGDVA